jgi:DNA modification methylase
MAYLAMMAVRLIELHRVLKPTGSLYLHCDPTASHYLKILMDAIFGAFFFRNEIIWLRSKNPKGSQHKAIRWGSSTDTILFYAKSAKNALDVDAAKSVSSTSEIAQRYPNVDELGRWADGPILRSDSMGTRPNLVYEYKSFTPGPAGWRMELEELIKVDEASDLYWTSEGRPRRKIRPVESELNPLSNCWTDIAPINSQAQERLGYPTQKPLTLLDRIIRASSNEGDVVLGPFCGCGTTIHAAQKLKRQWIGIDITHLAIALIERRLKEAFPGIAYKVNGVPKDADAARDLAERDKHEFQKWIVATIGGQPYKGGKKGMDRGVDGYLHFRDADNKPQMAIISVRGGATNSAHVRDLKGTMEREGAKLGFFLTLNPPTREMEKQAASAGFYETGGRKFLKVQILTAAQVIEGKRLQVPFGHTKSLKKASRESEDQQGRLLRRRPALLT